jgi:hypothetical protein
MRVEMQQLPELLEFDWDIGNRDKNRLSHKVEWWECEEVFFNYPLYTTIDVKHSEKENRFYGLGHTNGKRLLTIVFTLREKKIRIISARDMNKRERARYHEESANIQE